MSGTEVEPTGITSDVLIKLLSKLRVTDVYLKITDPESEELSRLRVHGACYNPDADTIDILAHRHY